MSDGTVAQRDRQRSVAWLVAGAAIVAALVLLVGAGYWWLTQAGPELGREVRAARLEGEAAASGTDYQGCLNQAAERVKDLSMPTATAIGNNFLGACMQRAAEPPGFCDVPSNVFGIRSWRQQRCEAVPADAKDSCALLVGSVQQLCKARHQPKS